MVGIITPYKGMLLAESQDSLKISQVIGVIRPAPLSPGAGQRITAYHAACPVDTVEVLQE